MTRICAGNTRFPVLPLRLRCYRRRTSSNSAANRRCCCANGCSSLWRGLPVASVPVSTRIVVVRLRVPRGLLAPFVAAFRADRRSSLKNKTNRFFSIRFSVDEVTLPTYFRLLVDDSAFVVEQVVPPPELPSAPIALEGLLVGVYQQMRLELVRIGEHRRAVIAGVRSFAGVYPEVSPQVRDLDELPVADVAMVRPLAGVQTHVRLEVVVPGEALVAFRTFEGLLSGVGALVVLEDVLVAEGAVADAAGELLVAVVVVVLGVGARWRRYTRSRRRQFHLLGFPPFLLRFSSRTAAAHHHNVIIVVIVVDGLSRGFRCWRELFVARWRRRGRRR